MSTLLVSAGAGLPALVSGRDRQGAAGRERAGARDDGDPPVGLCDLGAPPGGDRRADQGHGRAKRVLPAADPGGVHAAGGRARRGLQPRAGGGHPRRRQGARGAGGRPPDERDDRQLLVRPLDLELPRPAAADQPVGERGPVGASAAAVPSQLGVPLAGGPHRPRHPRGGARLRAADPRGGLHRRDGQRARDPGVPRPQDRPGEVRRRRHLMVVRGRDARREGAADGHFARARAELRAGVRDPVHRSRRSAPSRLAVLVGRRRRVCSAR